MLSFQTKNTCTSHLLRYTVHLQWKNNCTLCEITWASLLEGITLNPNVPPQPSLHLSPEFWDYSWSFNLNGKWTSILAMQTRTSSKYFNMRSIKQMKSVWKQQAKGTPTLYLPRCIRDGMHTTLLRILGQRATGYSFMEASFFFLTEPVRVNSSCL